MVNTDNRIYKPVFSRLLFSYVGLPILIILLIWGSRLFFDLLMKDIGNLGQRVGFILTLISAYAVVNFVLLLVNKGQFVITIDTSSVSGPSTTNLYGNPKTLPIDKLDTDKLLKRTFWEKLFFEKTIWSKDKEKIIISRLYFSKEQEMEIIQNLLSLSNGIQEQ